MNVSVDSSRLVASLHHLGAALDLKTIDLCFLAALYARGNDQGLSALEDEDMVAVFEQVCDLVEPGAENPRRRATLAIQRLREQGLLARIDGDGLARPGDYSLTLLSTGIVEFFIADSRDILDKKSLDLLTGQVIAALTEVLGAARQARTGQERADVVVGPLRVTVRDLVTGIDRRQRGLERQQEALKARISDLLAKDWFAAIDECEDLLSDSARTLAELKTVLLSRVHQMQGLLQDIEQAAEDQHLPGAAQEAREVASHLDRIAAWGNARQKSWSDYYEYIHDYLRDVVRLDPDRALSERLRDQLTGWPGNRFFLVIPQPQPMRVLRDMETRIVRPPVVRPSKDREADLDDMPDGPDPAEIVQRATDALARSPDTLASVVREVLAGLDEDRRYPAIGEVAALVAERAALPPGKDRPWVTLPGGYEIEDWPLRREAGK